MNSFKDSGIFCHTARQKAVSSTLEDIGTSLLPFHLHWVPSFPKQYSWEQGTGSLLNGHLFDCYRMGFLTLTVTISHMWPNTYPSLILLLGAHLWQILHINFQSSLGEWGFVIKVAGIFLFFLHLIKELLTGFFFFLQLSKHFSFELSKHFRPYGLCIQYHASHPTVP